MKNCIKCGYELNDDSEFCTQCGISQPQSAQKKCNNCGADLTSNDVFCKSCGTAITSENSSTNSVSSTANYSNESVVPAKSKKDSFAITGLVFGLISIVAWLLPLIGFPITILGIIFSSLGIKSSKKSLAIAGLVLSIIFLLLTMTNSILGVMMVLENSNLLY